MKNLLVIGIILSAVINNFYGQSNGLLLRYKYNKDTLFIQEGSVLKVADREGNKYRGKLSLPDDTISNADSSFSVDNHIVLFSNIKYIIPIKQKNIRNGIIASGIGLNLLIPGTVMLFDSTPSSEGFADFNQFLDYSGGVILVSIGGTLTGIGILMATTGKKCPAKRWYYSIIRKK